MKLWLAGLLHRLGWNNALVISTAERRRGPPSWQVASERFFRSTFAFAAALFAVCATITTVWGVTARQDVNQLWSEMGGMTLDVLVILIIYEAFTQRRAKREAVERQLEIVSDYKRWDAEEARLRIAGALRRLGRMGVSKINFAGLRLSDFAFAQHGIRSIRSSTFYDGDWGNPWNDSMVLLTRIDFNHIDCTGVQFSPFDPFETLDTFPERSRRYATFVDCTFVRTSLVKAVFNGAELRWSEEPPKSHFDTDEDEDGTPYSYQTSEGPFSEADLTGAQFRGCRLHHADFRGAENLRSADFFRAGGVETAIFDSLDDREWAIASATRPE